MARVCGLTHTRHINAFVSKVMVFDKSETSGSATRPTDTVPPSWLGLEPGGVDSARSARYNGNYIFR
jgi:hypothetical protein